MQERLTKACPGQAEFESCLAAGQAGIQVFFKPSAKVKFLVVDSSHPESN